MAKVEKVIEYRPVRERLPKRRASQTTSFAVGGAEGYLTAGTYADRRLGEMFLKFGKQGSTLAGVMDAFSIAISVALQYGVPLETFVEKFTNMRFEPAGLTDDPDIRMAQSIMDYVFRRLALDYLDFETRSYMGIYTAEERARQLETGSYTESSEEESKEDLDAEIESLSQGVSTTPKKKADAERAGRHRGEVRRWCGIGAAGRQRRPLLGRPHREVPGHCGRCPDLPHLWDEDASCWLVLRLRGMRKHQRLQLRSVGRSSLSSVVERDSTIGVGVDSRETA